MCGGNDIDRNHRPRDPASSLELKPVVHTVGSGRWPQLTILFITIQSFRELHQILEVDVDLKDVKTIAGLADHVGHVQGQKQPPPEDRDHSMPV